MLLPEMSVIAFVAGQTGMPCEQVFADAAVMTHRSVQAEMEDLRSFASAACETTNPDIIWQLAQQESSFRFRLVRINEDSVETSVVLRGDYAVKFTEDLNETRAVSNVDMGVLQMNWGYHGEGFNDDPRKMLDPKAQVEYLTDTFSGYLTKVCKGYWVGCYHNPKNEKLAAEYQARIENSGRLLARAGVAMLRLSGVPTNGHPDKCDNFFSEKNRLPFANDHVNQFWKISRKLWKHEESRAQYRPIARIQRVKGRLENFTTHKGALTASRD